MKAALLSRSWIAWSSSGRQAEEDDGLDFMETTSMIWSDDNTRREARRTLVDTGNQTISIRQTRAYSEFL